MHYTLDHNGILYKTERGTMTARQARDYIERGGPFLAKAYFVVEGPQEYTYVPFTTRNPLERVAFRDYRIKAVYAKVGLHRYAPTKP